MLNYIVCDKKLIGRVILVIGFLYFAITSHIKKSRGDILEAIYDTLTMIIILIAITL